MKVSPMCFLIQKKAYSILPSFSLLSQTRSIRLGQKMIMDQYAGSRSESRDNLAQDLDSICIRPIVKDVSKKIHVCRNGLLGEEVVGHEFDTFGDVRRHLCTLGGLDDFGPVLDDEMEQGIGLRNCHAHGAIGAAYVNNDTDAESAPIEVGDKGGWRDVGSLSECLHGSGESLRFLGMSV